MEQWKLLVMEIVGILNRINDKFQSSNVKMIKDTIKEKLIKAVEDAGYPGSEVEVLAASDQKFGDYYSTIALKLKQAQEKQSLGEIAKQIVAKLPKESEVFSVSIAPNGFINFHLTNSFLCLQTQKIIKENQDYGKPEIGKGKKARVEFVSANPTGPLHIGNARGGPLGDTIANILEFSGYKVLREYLNNNMGNQVYELGKTLAAKAGLIKANEGELTYKGDYTSELASKVKNQLEEVKGLAPDEIIRKVGEVGTELLSKDILKDISDMGIGFDLVVNESDLQKKLPEIFKELKSSLVKREGATWFAPKAKILGEDTFKDAGWVVIKSDGSYTYFASDIAYHKEKFESGYDLVVDVFGSNTSGHVPKLKSLTLEFGGPKEDFKVILYQFVRVKRGGEVVRMSKRAGDFVTAREVLDEVGKDAFRFTMLMYDPNTHMDFDLDQAKKQSEENPVYYIQYAYARCSNILKKAQTEGFDLKNLGNSNIKLLKTSSEMDLVRKLIKFPELISDIVNSKVGYPVHLLPLTTVRIADEMNRFYENVRVVGDDKDLSEARLALIMATKIVLHSSLQLMGISSPEYLEKR